MTEPGDQQRRIDTPGVGRATPAEAGILDQTLGVYWPRGMRCPNPASAVVGWGCAAILAVGGGSDSKSGVNEVEEQTVAVGETVNVADVTWQVTEARQANQLTAQFAEPVQGNFVIVNFSFSNNGSEPVTLDNNSLALIDSEGRESQTEADYLRYVPKDRDIFLERVNPGVTQEGQAIFEVAPGPSEFRLQAGDTNAFSDQNGYVDLGF